MSAPPSNSTSMPPSPFGVITPEELTESIQTSIIVVNIVITVLAVVAAGFRVWARLYMKQHFGLDDWFLFAAVPLAIGECAASVYAATQGMGKHIFALTPEQIPAVSKAFVATQIIWAAALPLVKTSVVFLYVRIFGTLHYFKRYAWALAAVNISWGLSVIFVCAFQCIPLEAVWTPTITDKQCINSGLFFIIGSIPDFATDILILILPMPAIWQLQLRTAQKLSILGVFLLGSFTCIVSIIRFAQLCVNGTNPDVTWALGSLAIWSTVEVDVGIIAACLPTMWPLIVRAIPSLRTMGGGSSNRNKYTPGGSRDFEMGSSAKNSKARSKYGYMASTDSNTGDYEQLNDGIPLGSRPTVRNDIRAEAGAWDNSMPSNRIKVERSAMTQ